MKKFNFMKIFKTDEDFEPQVIKFEDCTTKEQIRDLVIKEINRAVSGNIDKVEEKTRVFVILEKYREHMNRILGNNKFTDWKS